MGYNIFGRRANGEPGPIRVSDEGALSVGGSSIALQPDDNAEHGAYTLSATPGNVTTITIPAWARIAVVSEPSARVNWRVNGDPAIPGTNALTAGGNVAANGESAIILRSGAATLRLSSSTPSATVRVTFRGIPA